MHPRTSIRQITSRVRRRAMSRCMAGSVCRPVSRGPVSSHSRSRDICKLPKSVTTAGWSLILTFLPYIELDSRPLEIAVISPLFSISCSLYSSPPPATSSDNKWLFPFPCIQSCQLPPYTRPMRFGPDWLQDGAQCDAASTGYILAL